MTTTISPVLHYVDLDRAVPYLVETFGFVEHAVHRDDAGTPIYAEMRLDDWGLHLVDMPVVMGDLVALTKRQYASWAAAR